MAKAPLPRLDASLIIAKGAAAPSVAVSPAGRAPARASETERLVSVTLRLDQGRYERLKAHGARLRLSNQEILTEALDSLLAREGS